MGIAAAMAAIGALMFVNSASREELRRRRVLDALDSECDRERTALQHAFLYR